MCGTCSGLCVKAGSQYTVCCVVLCRLYVDACVAMQCGARIDLDSILVFLCIKFLRLITKKSLKFICVSRINVMQGLALLCELAFMPHEYISVVLTEMVILSSH